jgi:hypothetical protein
MRWVCITKSKNLKKGNDLVNELASNPEGEPSGIQYCGLNREWRTSALRDGTSQV